MFLNSIAALRRRWRPRIATTHSAPTLDGCVEELSPTHVAGWLLDPRTPTDRVAYEVICQRTNRVLATGLADQYRHKLHVRGIGDGAVGFHARLPPHGDIVVRPAGSQQILPVSPECRTTFEPVLHVAMDIVDNCNLRCPFCLYDYSNTRTTHFMSPEMLQLALTLLPFVRDGQFWFSCLHEPTLHPQLTTFIDSVPAPYRKKLFYTTNLAKRMPDSYFDWLARSGMYNINISIESLDPAIYERMRKGARHHIFLENWEKLLAAFARAPAPPRIRYIAMAYKSNVEELPGLASYLLEQRQAWQVELRYTFDLPYIPADFRAAEFLDAADWVRLRERLPVYPIEQLLLITPPEPASAEAPAPALPVEAAPASITLLPDYYMMRLSWDGTLQVSGVCAASRHNHAPEHPILTTNLTAMGDAGAFIDRLSADAA